MWEERSEEHDPNDLSNIYLAKITLSQTDYENPLQSADGVRRFLDSVLRWLGVRWLGVGGWTDGQTGVSVAPSIVPTPEERLL